MNYPLIRGTVVAIALFAFIYVLSQQYYRPRRQYDSDTLVSVHDSSYVIPTVPSKGHDKNARVTYTYKVLDAELCNVGLEFTDRTRVGQAQTDGCPKNGIVTVVTGGRTANQIWEYASVWAIARLTRLEPYVCSCVKQHIEPLFERLSLPTLKDIAHCPVKSEVYVMSTDQWRHRNESIILPRYVNDVRALMWADELRQEFKFKKELTDKAENTLSKFLENRTELEYTFVGVHVRRTDYIDHLKYKYGKQQKPVGPEFYTKGMQFYRDRFPNCLFVFVSDEPQWCADQFGHLEDVEVVWNNTPGEDLALLAACNHSVFDYGTFGEWGAILAGGMAVYSNLLGLTFIILTLIAFIYVFDQQCSTLGLVNNNFIKSKVPERPLNKNALLMYTYKVLDAELCDSKLKFPNRTKIAQRTVDKCPENGIVTVETGGRTANQMWEYASVWATARLTRLDPYIPSCIKHHLEPIFDNLSLSALSDIADCPLRTNLFVTSVRKWTGKDETIILPRYISDERALRWPDDLREEFKFKKKLVDKAEATLKGFIENFPKLEYTFIGVHVRRTDYIKHLANKFNKLPAGPKFYKRAMRFYSTRFPNCLFVFVSDDPKWCSQQFGQLKNVMVSRGNTPGEDLALLAACNHTVFDYGTFGEWGAILAGGMTVYSNLSQNIRKGNPMKDRLML